MSTREQLILECSRLNNKLYGLLHILSERELCDLRDDLRMLTGETKRELDPRMVKALISGWVFTNDNTEKMDISFENTG